VGIAIVTKHSGILVLPTLALLALVDLFLPAIGNTAAPQDRKHHLRQLIFALITICIVSYLILWAIYGFRYAARPGQLQMVPSLTAYAATLTRPLQFHLITFFARHHLLPEAYLYGWVDILGTAGTRPSFLFGHVYAAGQWFFLPAVFLIKTTLTLLILLLLVPFVLFARIANRRREFLFLTLPIAFFVLAAFSSRMNMGVRYLLPIYPFCIILAAATAASLFHRSAFAKIAVAVLLLFTVVSSLHCYPNFLVYSNELFGGPSHSYRTVTDANADWGQGLKWTKTYLDQHPDPNCWLDYHGNPGVSLAYYGISCKPLLSGFSHIIGRGGDPISSTISGTVLISSTETSGLLWGPDNLNPYAPFRDRTPDDTIGNIIFVYRGTFDVPLLAAVTNASDAIGLMRQGQLPQALALAQTAAQQAPNSADVNATLGQILIASGRAAEGQQAIAKALHLAQTNHPEYQKDLIDELQHPHR
jgi:hypothetical protein